MNRLNQEILFAGSHRPAVIGAAGEITGTTGSTMDLAKSRTAEGAPDGYIVLAEHQTSGRGRNGAWDSDAGLGLLMSVILKAGFRSSDRMLIAIMGAVSAAEAVQSHGIKARIKWPNDIVIERRRDDILNLKKLGGVLAEQICRGDAAPAHVLGIGININQDISQLPQKTRLAPTSMRTELGRPVDRNQVCLALMRQLDEWYKKLRLGKREELLARWKNLSCLIGKTLVMKHKGAPMKGQVIGLSVYGELILEEASGGKKHYLSDKDSEIMLAK